MSAVFGILRTDGQDNSARDVERLAKALAHRGPDRVQVWHRAGVALGHCLLRVTQEDKFDSQPLFDNEANLTLVADVRLDNRDLLAEALAFGRTWPSGTPDSAILLHAYKKWGEECADRLLGDFVFVIWDGRERKLVFCRDHMGQRGLVFHRGQGFLAFASEIGALWHLPDVPRAISDEAVARLLTNDLVPRDGRALFDGIEGLSPATVMTVRADGTTGTRLYWEPRAADLHERRDEAYYVEAYREVLGEAVACRLRRTIKPTGLLFSGGYDSTAIAALARPVVSGQQRRLIAAASVMPEEYRGTIRHARSWVEMCAREMPHLDVHYVMREGKNVLTGLERRFVETSLPSGNYFFVQEELLSAVARAGATVVMDGHGGDYTLHPRGDAALARFLAEGRLIRFLSELGGHLKISRHSLWQTLRHDLAPALAPEFVHLFWHRMKRAFWPARSRIVARGLENRLSPQGMRVVTLGARNRASIKMRAQMKQMLGDVAAYLVPGLTIEAARHRLELTRPFHDKRVVELALAIPEDLYVKGGRTRYLACTALKDAYPGPFQTRSSMNDDEIPDFLRMAKSLEPAILAEIDRMERVGQLSRYVDFTGIRHLLAARGRDDHNSGWETETHLALHGFLAARYVEWFRRDNR